jgi:transketolase
MTCYRAGRPALPVLYDNEEVFQIGKAKILRQSDDDKVLFVKGIVSRKIFFLQEP